MNKEQRMKVYLLKWGCQGGKQPSVLSRTPSASVNRLHFGCFQSINCGSVDQREVCRCVSSVLPVIKWPQICYLWRKV